jgi:uncharacterized membrane protein
MSSKKYDTNPLDHDVKKVADQSMGAIDEDRATVELPDTVAGANPVDTSEAQTNALDQNSVPQHSTPRPTSSPGLSSPTRAANPMTQADMHTPGTGPAYLPPGAGPASSGYQPQNAGAPPRFQPGFQQGYQQGYQPGYQAGYQHNPQSGGYNPQYPPTYAPVSPRGGYGQPRFRKQGLGIDPNIQGALGYVPWFGWIMAIAVLIKEPKTNMFARFHAFQALLLHGGLFVLGMIFSILIQAVAPISNGGLAAAPFVALGGIIKVVAFIGFVFLGIMTFQMKTVKIPYISDLVEKYNV